LPSKHDCLAFWIINRLFKQILVIVRNHIKRYQWILQTWWESFIVINKHFTPLMKTPLHSFPVKEFIIRGYKHYFTFLDGLVGLEHLDQTCGDVETIVDLRVM
jgi:hypothetical protein